MQAFLNARAELTAQAKFPEQLVEDLKSCGYPAIKRTQKLSTSAHGETFLVDFQSPAPSELAPTSSGDDRTQAIVHVIGTELGTSPFFSSGAFSSLELVKRALATAAAAGAATPRLWASGELVRRGGLRRLPWVLMEKVGAHATTETSTAGVAASSLPVGPEVREWLPRYDDAFAFLAELRRLAIASGATELDAPLAKLAVACRDKFQIKAEPPQFFLHRSAAAARANVAALQHGAASDADTKPALVELEGGDGGPGVGEGEAPEGYGATAPWAGAAAGDARIAGAAGEPWDLVRAFADVVKVRWLMDVLRRSPGDAPRCDLHQLLQAHDAAQQLLAKRGWLPAAIIAPGSSSARLAETFPEEMCPNY